MAATLENPKYNVKGDLRKRKEKNPVVEVFVDKADPDSKVVFSKYFSIVMG
jgi:hypothetical protein